MKVQVHTTLKEGVLDPQGKAVEAALNNLGFSGICLLYTSPSPRD